METKILKLRTPNHACLSLSKYDVALFKVFENINKDSSHSIKIVDLSKITIEIIKTLQLATLLTQFNLEIHNYQDFHGLLAIFHIVRLDYLVVCYASPFFLTLLSYFFLIITIILTVVLTLQNYKDRYIFYSFLSGVHAVFLYIFMNVLKLPTLILLILFLKNPKEE